MGTSGLATALSKGGTVARAASGALIAYDAAGNAVGTIQGAYDATQNGINLENGLAIAGGALGLAANAKAAHGLSQAASAAKLKQVDEFIAKCRKPTPIGTAANQYEIRIPGRITTQSPAAAQSLTSTAIKAPRFLRPSTSAT